MEIPLFFIIVSIIFALCNSHDVKGTEARLQRFDQLHKYYLYSRQNVHDPIEVSVDSIESVEINSALDTVVIIHGHLANNDMSFEEQIKNAFLQTRDYNVIIVDWTVVANMNYNVAINLVPKIGENVATFLQAFSDAGDTTSPDTENTPTPDTENTPAPDTENTPEPDNETPTPPGLYVESKSENSYEDYSINDKRNAELFAEESSKMHIVGFGLGAHVAGIVARNMEVKVDRITGLDPAGLNWGPNSERLSASDADYVEVIHTDGFGVRANGISEPLGNVDFYPNGGKDRQPGCPNQLCSHNRAWELYEASILNPGRLLGARCRDFKEMESNRCTGTKLEMGGVESQKFASGIFRLNTKSVYPYV